MTLRYMTTIRFIEVPIYSINLSLYWNFGILIQFIYFKMGKKNI